MRAGDLRHEMTVQRPEGAVNAAGEMPANLWHNETTVDAAIRPASAREVMLNQGSAQQVSHTVTIRYLDYIDTTRRLVDRRGRVFNIAGVINVDERDVELRLVCYVTGGAPCP